MKSKIKHLASPITLELSSDNTSEHPSEDRPDPKRIVVLPSLISSQSHSSSKHLKATVKHRTLDETDRIMIDLRGTAA